MCCQCLIHKTWAHPNIFLSFAKQLLPFMSGVAYKILSFLFALTTSFAKQLDSNISLHFQQMLQWKFYLKFKLIKPWLNLSEAEGYGATEDYFQVSIIGLNASKKFNLVKQGKISIKRLFQKWRAQKEQRPAFSKEVH